MRALALACAVATIVRTSQQVLSPPASAAVVAVSYQGVGGAPRPVDLGEMRAAGFRALTWPASNSEGLVALTKMAAAEGLEVIPARPVAPLTPDAARSPAEFVRIEVGRLPASAIAPLAWRAIAHGARTVAFEAATRQGLGLFDANRDRQPWVQAAIEIGNQLRANGALFAQRRPGPAVRVDPPVHAGLDIGVLDAGKAWVLIGTNTSATRAHATAHLAPDVPYAMWLNLLDGSTMAMLETTSGPAWTTDIGPQGVKVYVIDKKLR